MKKKKEKRGNRNSSKSNQSLLPIDRFVSRKFWPGQDIIDGEQKAPFTVLSEWYSISFFPPKHAHQKNGYLEIFEIFEIPIRKSLTSL